MTLNSPAPDAAEVVPAGPAFSAANDLIDNGHGIYTIDAHYVAPRVASIHLIVGTGAEGVEAAFFDTGTNHSWPYVSGALAALGIKPEQVRYVIPSHVHLDHAGGAGKMIENFPRAKLVVHPRGARHLVDPSKLFAATIAVYGEATTHRLYGELVPVPADRVIEAADGMVLKLGQRELLLLDTPGHAKHHVCLRDGQTGGCFTGDTFGLSYRQFDVAGRPSIIPTTTPSQFDPAAMRASIERLLAFNPPAMYLTHFGKVREVARLGESLLNQLERLMAMAQSLRDLPAAERHTRIRAGLSEHFLAESKRLGWSMTGPALMKWLETDIELNAQGLGVWLDGAA